MIIQKRVVVIPEELVPAKRVEYEAYIADDGKEFLNERECRKHEKEVAYAKLKQNPFLKLPVFTKNIPDNATLVKLKTENDFDVIVEKYEEESFLDPACEFKGWGVYCVTFSEDSRYDDYHFRNALFIRPVEDVIFRLKEVLNIIEGFTVECAE